MSGKHMDALVARATRRLEDLETALDGLQHVRGRATSADGLVTAEVDANGALADLQLAEAIITLPAAEIGPLITRTCAEAVHTAAEQRARIVETLNGAFAGQAG